MSAWWNEWGASLWAERSRLSQQKCAWKLGGVTTSHLVLFGQQSSPGLREAGALQARSLKRLQPWCCDVCLIWWNHPERSYTVRIPTQHHSRDNVPGPASHFWTTGTGDERSLPHHQVCAVRCGLWSSGFRRVPTNRRVTFDSWRVTAEWHVWRVLPQLVFPSEDAQKE